MCQRICILPLHLQEIKTQHYCISVRWEPRGGKSNSFFAKTRDDRFIVKQLSAAERKSFQEMAPNYFAYLARAMRNRQPTCLAKIMGVFTVSFSLPDMSRIGLLIGGIEFSDSVL